MRATARDTLETLYPRAPTRQSGPKSGFWDDARTNPTYRRTQFIAPDRFVNWQRAIMVESSKTATHPAGFGIKCTVSDGPVHARPLSAICVGREGQ